MFHRQGSSVKRPSIDSQWADCDAHPVATVPRNVRLQTAGCHTAAPGTSGIYLPVSVTQRGEDQSTTQCSPDWLLTPIET